MRVIKPGQLPKDRILRGTCPTCGCEVETTAGECPDKSAGCPTAGCVGRIKLRVARAMIDPDVRWAGKSGGARGQQ